MGRLGAGGMGVVYAGLAPDGARVAVKLVHDSLAGDPEFRMRFAREISVLTRVRGLCTARILESDADAARPWLAAEYVPGRTLGDHVRADGPLTGDQWFGLVVGLAEALVAVHAVDVVHRDIKPSNVILAPNGPKLVDFGIARALDGTSVTRTGALVGTPGWLSPEEYRSTSAGPAADVYGWGLLAVYAATGRPPYGTARPEVLALRVLNDPVDTSEVPEPLRELVGRALAKDPASRPSAREILAEASQAWRIDGTDELTTRLDHTWEPPVEDVSWRKEEEEEQAGQEEQDSPDKQGEQGRRETRKGGRRRGVLAGTVAVAVVGVAGAVLWSLPDGAGLFAAPSSTPRSTPPSAPVSTPPASPSTVPASTTLSTPPPPSTTPATPVRPEAPKTTADLAAALDLALTMTPSASFSYEGGFTQSSAVATVTGRVVNRTAHAGRDDFDIRIGGDEFDDRHVVVRDGVLYPGKKNLLSLKAGTAEWAVLMVAGTAGPSVIGEVVANSTRMERKGHTYSGTLAVDKTNGLLRELLDSWMGGDVMKEGSRSYLTYLLTTDTHDRPKAFHLVWSFPTGSAGIYRADFTTTYSDWRSAE
ncbi:serine/threonine-protein kinase [Streptosporangium sp. NPDC020145]|uniref:serine/threonine-protein kinase n=1 Tax=Streptosporangium sp. NPDC020145 TaxID=3154694 RepID=UPI003443B2C5